MSPVDQRGRGRLYEKTTSLGPGTFGKVDAATDILIAWSKWAHDLP